MGSDMVIKSLLTGMVPILFSWGAPEAGGFAICAGLEQLIDYLKNLHFTEEDINYFRSKKIFDEGFLDYLAKARVVQELEKGVLARAISEVFST